MFKILVSGTIYYLRYFSWQYVPATDNNISSTFQYFETNNIVVLFTKYLYVVLLFFSSVSVSRKLNFTLFSTRLSALVVENSQEQRSQTTLSKTKLGAKLIEAKLAM